MKLGGDTAVLWEVMEFSKIAYQLTPGAFERACSGSKWSLGAVWRATRWHKTSGAWSFEMEP